MPSQSVSPLALWISQNAGRRVYAVRSDDSWSQTAVRALQSALSSRKGTLVGTATADSAGANVRAALRDVKTANPDVLWCLLPPEGAERFAQALGEMDVHALVVISSWDEISAMVRRFEAELGQFGITHPREEEELDHDEVRGMPHLPHRLVERDELFGGE